jgi:hypothetical protein
MTKKSMRSLRTQQSSRCLAKSKFQSKSHLIGYANLTLSQSSWCLIVGVKDTQRQSQSRSSKCWAALKCQKIWMPTPTTRIKKKFPKLVTTPKARTSTRSISLRTCSHHLRAAAAPTQNPNQTITQRIRDQASENNKTWSRRTTRTMSLATSQTCKKNKLLGSNPKILGEMSNKLRRKVTMTIPFEN